jgi:tetratricopeptide (TPR) repeat protein
VTVDATLALRFARGEAGREETAALVGALLLEEPPAAPAPFDLEPVPAADAYVSVLSGLEQRAVELSGRDAEERRLAAELLARLDTLVTSRERRRSIENDPQHHSWTFAELLRERSSAEAAENPERSRELARYAVEVAGRVPAGPESEALRADLRALAWAQLGNAERTAGELRAAEGAFRAAWDLLERGTVDSIARARVLSLHASLRGDQSRFDEAIGLASRAARLYRRAGDLHGYGRTLIKLATFHAYRDELDVACVRLDEAVPHIDPAREPRTLFAVHFNRAMYLERAGRLDEAAVELEIAKPLAPTAIDQIRLGWLSGLLTFRRGDTEAGERELLAAREAYLGQGLAYETAQVSLDLAVLYAEQGRTADQHRLAREIVPLFAARDVHPEARAALALYCDAARAEGVSASLARELADYLERAHDRPRLVFTPR